MFNSYARFFHVCPIENEDPEDPEDPRAFIPSLRDTQDTMVTKPQLRDAGPDPRSHQDMAHWWKETRRHLEFLAKHGDGRKMIMYHLVI
jgi:hypothetical protein